MKFCILYFIYLAAVWMFYSGAERIRYIITEQPVLESYNKEYLKYANITSRRYGRRDPFYYVDIHLHSVYETTNNVTVNFYFFEFLSNSYKRGFVEMHWRICDFIEKDKFFGAAMRQGPVLHKPCPFPAGPYHLVNMTVPLTQIPKNFPFTKGRIYCNLTKTINNEVIGHGYINMEIKERTIKNKNIK